MASSLARDDDAQRRESRLRERIAEVRADLDRWLDRLGASVGGSADAHPPDDAAIYECTRMVAYFGSALGALADVFTMLWEGPRPAGAWDGEAADRAMVLLRRASATLSGRAREDVVERLSALREGLSCWCPGWRPDASAA